MKTRVLAGLAAGMLALGTPVAAHSTDESYVMSVSGTCGFRLVNDTYSGGRLGGSKTWYGVVYLAAVRLNGGDLPPDVTVWCELEINSVPWGTVLGPTTANGVVVDEAPLTLWNDAADIVSLCDHVIVGAETTVTCHDATLSQTVPQPVADAAGPVADLATGELGDMIVLLNPTLCPVLATLAPTVNGQGHPELVYVDPSHGDVYAGGTSPGDIVWDCPPYVTP